MSRKNKYYNSKEDQYLIENFDFATNEELGAKLGRSKQSIASRLNDLGVTRNIRITPKSTIAKAYELYVFGLKIVDICTLTGLHRNTLSNHIKEIKGYKGKNPETITIQSKI